MLAETLKTITGRDPIVVQHVKPSTERVTLSRLEFTRRFTMTENATIAAVRINTATPLMVRAQLEALKEYLERATLIDVTDADTILGAGVAVDVLISAGAVPSTERAARLAAILAPAPL